MLKRPLESLGVGTITNVTSVAMTASSTFVVAVSLARLCVDEFLQPRFLDRRLARVECVDEALVQIDTDDVESLAGEHRREGSAELTQTNDRNLHGIVEKHSEKQKEYRRPRPEGSI